MELEKLFYIEDVNKKARYLMNEYGNKDEMVRQLEDAQYQGFQHCLDVIKGLVVVKDGEEKPHIYKGSKRKTIATFKGSANDLKEFIKEGGFVEWMR